MQVRVAVPLPGCLADAVQEISDDVQEVSGRGGSFPRNSEGNPGGADAGEGGGIEAEMDVDDVASKAPL